jgi:hypothetical protein
MLSSIHQMRCQTMCSYFPFILIIGNFNCFICDARVSTLPKNLSLSWTAQNFCFIQVTIGPMALSSTSITQRKSPSSTCHHYILTHMKVYVWTKEEEMHINEKKKRIEGKTWHHNWNRTLCIELYERQNKMLPHTSNDDLSE